MKRIASLVAVAALATGPAGWAQSQTVTPDPAQIPAEATTPAEPDVTVKLGRKPATTPLYSPLETKRFELPPVVDPTAPVAPSAPDLASIVPPAAAPVAPEMPAGPLSKEEIARQIAPNFNVATEYTRLVQCYGTADFMGAITRIQASRPGAPAQVVNVAREIMALSDAMQPMVLAASTVRGEPRFRADYDAFARQGQRELASSKNPNALMQRRLATLEACRKDIVRWRKEG
jgi:hypothetical protein